jgi:hypothetical protein
MIEWIDAFFQLVTYHGEPLGHMMRMIFLYDGLVVFNYELYYTSQSTFDFIFGKVYTWISI